MRRLLLIVASAALLAGCATTGPAWVVESVEFCCTKGYGRYYANCVQLDGTEVIAAKDVEITDDNAPGGLNTGDPCPNGPAVPVGAKGVADSDKPQCRDGQRYNFNRGRCEPDTRPTLLERGHQ